MTPKVLLLLAFYAVSILGDESVLEKFILSFNEKIDGMVCHYISDHSNKSMIYNCHTTSLVNSTDNSSVSEMHFIEISGFIHSEEDWLEEEEQHDGEDEEEQHDGEEEQEEQQDGEDEEEQHDGEDEQEEEEEEYLDAITNDGQIYEDDHSGVYYNTSDAVF